MMAILPDLIRPGLRVVFCGTAVGTASANVGAYYAGRGNRFWSTLHLVGLTPRELDPTEYRLLLDHGIGLTDVCKTKSGSDQEVGTAGFDIGRLHSLIEANGPKLVAFNGKAAGKAVLGREVEFGSQPERIGGARVFVLPSTSGAARAYWDLRPWHDLATAAKS
jgi:TDG/mug DNA glycosylase family protein